MMHPNEGFFVSFKNVYMPRRAADEGRADTRHEIKKGSKNMTNSKFIEAIRKNDTDNSVAFLFGEITACAALNDAPAWYGDPQHEMYEENHRILRELAEGYFADCL